MRRALGLAFLLLASVAAPGAGQAPGLWVRMDDTTTLSLDVSEDRGFAALPVSALTQVGWDVLLVNDTVHLQPRTPALPLVRVVAGSPFVWWADALVHLAHAPYFEAGQVFVPTQLVVDLLPERAPAFAFNPLTRTLEPRVDLAFTPPRPSRPAGPRLVIIDAGHGGRDPGTRGASGVREKDITLGVALALRDELARDTAFQVLLTRDRDVLIPIWRRGEQATIWRGERPAVFVSLHANALPGSRATRGFETYVLSEARTEHARRVAALENQAEGQPHPAPTDEGDAGDLDGILSELRNLGHQPWSVLLAEFIQEELEPAHTGRNRGVLQAPLAVLTNALMPGVLVELGYLTNPQDEALLRTSRFQQDAARAIVRALHRFFERYPPGDSPPEPDGP